jgi:hypothetical protein
MCKRGLEVFWSVVVLRWFVVEGNRLLSFINAALEAYHLLMHGLAFSVNVALKCVREPIGTRRAANCNACN